MGKELACEGNSGTARVVWCTHYEMDSEVWLSLSQGGPYQLVASSATEVQCHDFTFPIIAIDSTHYFYVKSENEKCGTLQSAIYTFCTGGTVIVATGGMFGGYPSITKPTVVSFHHIQNGMFSTAVDIVHPSDSSLVTPFQASIEFNAQTVHEFDQDASGSFSTNIASAVVAPTP
jgi:hypothetical protein